LKTVGVIVTCNDGSAPVGTVAGREKNSKIAAIAAVKRNSKITTTATIKRLICFTMGLLPLVLR